MSSLRFAAIWSSALCLISAMVLITVFATYPLVFNNEVHRIFVIAVIIFAPVAPFAALRAKAYAINLWGFFCLAAQIFLLGYINYWFN
mgnify:CR=1 FL=1